MARPFTPTFAWHIKTLAILLILCTAAYFVISYGLSKAPAQYRPKKPVPETTPWLHGESK